jgi:WD40 repeat protein
MSDSQATEVLVDEGVFWIERRAAWTTSDNRKGEGVDRVVLGVFARLMTLATISGLAALNTIGSLTVLAIPGRQVGHVQLIHLKSEHATDPGIHDTQPSHSGSQRVPIIIAHSHAISSLAISPDNRYLVTASTHGTLLRMWDMRQGQLVRELRRGADRANIWGMAFSHPAQGSDGAAELACWSDKGTVHVWKYDEEPGGSRRMSSDSQKSRKGL